MKRILHEPLFHFLLIGGLLFFLFSRFGEAGAREDAIIIDENDLDRLIDTWQMQWQRPPTQSELDNILAEHIKQEVYYREALKMRLDHNDEIVKRRLYQKMEFLMEDISEVNDPTEEELQEYYKAHMDKYMLSPRVTLSSIYFSPDKREDAFKDAETVLPTLSERSDPLEYGDVSMVPMEFEDADHMELSRMMGEGFARAVMALEAGSWQGPVRSGFGVHLVFVHERTESAEPEMVDIREALLKDYLYDRQEEFREKVYADLRSNYKLVFEVEGMADSLTLEMME